jgi:catalase
MTMPPDESRDGVTPKRALSSAGMLLRLGVIGAILLFAVVIFAAVGGWFSPGRMTQSHMVAGFEQVNGNHPGFRLNHAKGLCVAGSFESKGQAIPISKAVVFQVGRVPAIGRISLAGGMPFQADKAATVRSMALRLAPPGAEEWRTATVNIPVFVVNSAQGFYDQTLASAPDPATGKPDPDAMNAFFAKHPEAVNAMAIIKKSPPSSGFADSTFYGLDAFRFVNAAGVSVPVRWSWVPVQPVLTENPTPSATTTDNNYLFDALIAQITAHPLQWRLMVTIGEAGDPTNDATLPWPAERRQIEAGTVTFDHVSSEATGRCADINYDPLVLPSGIEASDDPLLSARSAVYARSFTLRAGEQPEKPPGALTAEDVRNAAK